MLGKMTTASYTAPYSISQQRKSCFISAAPFPFTGNQQDAHPMLKKLAFMTCLACLSSSAVATLQCGPFTLKPDSSGWFFVNGERARTQKVTFTKQKGDYNNVMIKLRVKNSRAPGMVDLEQTTQAGKRMLRAEIVRTSQSQIRIRGAYDCEQAN